MQECIFIDPCLRWPNCINIPLPAQPTCTGHRWTLCFDEQPTVKCTCITPGFCCFFLAKMATVMGWPKRNKHFMPTGPQGKLLWGKTWLIYCISSWISLSYTSFGGLVQSCTQGSIFYILEALSLEFSHLLDCVWRGLQFLCCSGYCGQR